MFDLNVIKINEDKVLISDAVKLCDQNFFRASYIMAWLACVESLKRRFVEAGRKANNINKCVGEIRQKEEQHKSVDKFIIEKSKEFNFISDTEKEKLDYFYNMRCVYSHPYEQAPTKLDCEHIINSIIDIVLSRPVFLREGGISSVLEKIINEKSFLNDNEYDVTLFIEDLLERIEPNCYKFFFGKLISEFEKITKENEGTFLYNRLNYSISAVLTKLGFSKLFDNDSEIEDFIISHKKVCIYFFTSIDAYKAICQRGKDILFNLLIDNPNHRKLNDLYRNRLLSNIQVECLKEVVKSLSCLDMSYYDADLIVTNIINKLKTHNWNVQNPVRQILDSEVFIETVKYVNDEILVTLGRNILQASEAAWDINNFLEDLQNKTLLYPENLFKGIFLECFINEQKKIRPKLKNIICVENLLKNFSTTKQQSLLEGIKNTINDYAEKETEGWDEISNDSIFSDIRDSILA